MEALFSTTLATYEAWIMLLCVIVFLVIYLFDGIGFIQRIYIALRPAKPQGLEESLGEVISPLLEPIASSEVEAHDREKAQAEEKHEQEVIASEVFEEKVLEEIQLAEKADTAEELKENHSIPSNEAIEEGRGIAHEYEESQEVIENDLEEKEKIEEELLDVIEEVEKTEETNETEEVVSEISSEALTESETVDEPINQSEVRLNSSYTIEEQAQQELDPEVENREEKDTEEKPSVDNTNTAEKVTSSEESHALPITASIPEVTTDSRKSMESQNTEKLYSIVSEVKTLLARGLTQDARALIIEGLSLDKNHRELNLILGSIYESERQAQKAEYIYKDLALTYGEDGEILERLANILIIEKRYDLALEIYKKITSLSGETEGSLYIMTHLAHELSHHEELYAYARRYQKNWPNNPDILTLLAQAEIALGERQAAIQTLIKLKNLTPYNNEIMETIAKLTMEEELAGNFGGEKI